MRALLALLVVGTSFCLCVPGHADEWPSRPIRLVMPFAPGGIVETVLAATRDIAEARLGQRLVLEHRPGAGGNVGLQAVLSAPADGHTLAVVPSNTMVVNQFLFKSMPFDPLRDFVPVLLLVDVPLVLSVSNRLPAQTLTEFVGHARANPGQVHYGSPGAATPPHLAAALLARTAGLDLVHVPYKGGAAAATALMANEVQFMLIAYTSLAGQIQGGRVRALGVLGAQRLASLPDTPTFAESGLGALDSAMPRTWWGIVAPRGTPDIAIERTASAFADALAQPQADRRLREAGLVPAGSRRTAFATQMDAEARVWQAKVAEFRISIE
jgi:tripartite-type tricarboxylate transporter receptor subunit TctC